MKKVEKGNTIEFMIDGEKIIAKCTGVTHENVIHYHYKTSNGTPMAGMVGRSNIVKVGK